MRITSQHLRRVATRRSLLLERLDPRVTPSASPINPFGFFASTAPVSAYDTVSQSSLSEHLSVVATDPAADAALDAAPATISVTFDRPIDPWLLGFGDVGVEQLVDGAWVSALDLYGYPMEEVDASGSTLVLNFDQPLPMGIYRLVLPQFNSLFGLDGSVPLGTGADQILSQFTIGLDSISDPDSTDPVVESLPPFFRAVDLNGPEPLGAAPAVVRGSLGLAASPGDFALYRFTLGPGHHWRLGAEISAGRIGSPLFSTLALFDADGRLIGRSDHGRSDAPGDPYLFAGLDAGTYYLGISGAGNVPGQPGGYDPLTGAEGATPASSAGGDFELQVTADQADAPTRLLGYGLNYADPLSSRPTGVTLGFSGPLNLAGLKGSAAPGLVLADAQGRTFAVTAVGQRESLAQYDLIWSEQLPPGDYTLRVAAAANAGQGGLADLAGLTPVAPGQPAGVLARFRVVDRGAAQTGPGDLGALFSQEAADGVGRDVHLAPGTSTSYRFVVLTEGLYQVESVFKGGTLTVNVIGNGYTQTYPGGPAGGSVKSLIALKPGVYYLQFKNPDSAPLTLSWTLKQSTPAESLLLNGAGQGPALNLRLVNPSSSELANTTIALITGPIGSPSDPAPSAPGTTDNPSPITEAGPGTAPEVSGHVGPATPAISAPVLYLTPSTSLVGRPSTGSGLASPVAIAAANAPTSLPSPGESLVSATGAVTAWGSDPPAEVQAESLAASPPLPSDTALVPARIGGEAHAAMVAEAIPPENALDLDLDALFSSDFLQLLSSRAGRMLAFLGGGAEGTPMGEEQPSPASGDGSGSAPRREVEHAQFGNPLILGTTTILAIQYSPTVRAWLARGRARQQPETKHGIPRPHCRF